jgi:hypothetical protein
MAENRKENQTLLKRLEEFLVARDYPFQPTNVLNGNNRSKANRLHSGNTILDGSLKALHLYGDVIERVLGPGITMEDMMDLLDEDRKL